MNEYLLFTTHYVDEEGTQEVYPCWVFIPSCHNNGEVTDKEFLEECHKQQAPIFTEEGFTIQDITIERKSEFEYKQYERSNKDKVRYHREQMKAQGWNY